jgi:23S rRNA pseudouridine2604 synthase
MSDATPGLVRLSKRMAELGLCSRREADVFIAEGRVRVDGEVVDVLGTKVLPSARIELDAAAARSQADKPTVLLHKPIGYVSGQPEDGYRAAVELITPENRWRQDPNRRGFDSHDRKGLAVAGRLDIDSTGLLLLTADGRIARQVIAGDGGVEKEYLVRVEGDLSDRGMQYLRHGMRLDGRQLRPAEVTWQNYDQLRFVLREGRKRQIRRMCEIVGLEVLGLKRVRIGNIALGQLPVGSWRLLGPREHL